MSQITICPYCSEEILAVAKKCKHCNEFLDNEQNIGYHSKPNIQTQSCSLAVIAFVFAMTSLLFGLTCIPAIICGHIAISQCNNNPSLQGRGYAVTALIIGYFIFILGLLVVLFWLFLAGIVFTTQTQL